MEWNTFRIGGTALATISRPRKGRSSRRPTPRRRRPCTFTTRICAGSCPLLTGRMYTKMTTKESGEKEKQKAPKKAAFYVLLWAKHAHALAPAQEGAGGQVTRIGAEEASSQGCTRRPAPCSRTRTSTLTTSATARARSARPGGCRTSALANTKIGVPLEAQVRVQLNLKVDRAPGIRVNNIHMFPDIMFPVMWAQEVAQSDHFATLEVEADPAPAAGRRQGFQRRSGRCPAVGSASGRRSGSRIWASYCIMWPLLNYI